MSHEIDVLRARIASLEVRVSALETFKRNHTSTPHQHASEVAEAITDVMPQLRGSMTATDVAQAAGLAVDQSSLIQIGRYLDAQGIPRTRNAKGRMFKFSEPEAIAHPPAANDQGGPSNRHLMGPVQWFDSVVKKSGAELRGTMSIAAILTALDVPNVEHNRQRVIDAMQAKGISRLEGDFYQFR